MHGVRERVLLRHLLEQDISISEAARQLGVHRATLHRWIEAGLLDTDTDEIRARYTPRPTVPTKLDPFKSVLTERLREFPALTAGRLLAEIRAARYTGGYSQTRDYVRTLRPTPRAEPVVPSRRRRRTKRRSTSPTAGCPGACATPWSWSSRTRAGAGCSSSRARTSAP